MDVSFQVTMNLEVLFHRTKTPTFQEFLLCLQNGGSASDSREIILRNSGIISVLHQLPQLLHGYVDCISSVPCMKKLSYACALKTTLQHVKC